MGTDVSSCVKKIPNMSDEMGFYKRIDLQLQFVLDYGLKVL